MSGILDYLGRPVAMPPQPRPLAFGGAYDGAVDSRMHPKAAGARSLPFDEDHVVGAVNLDLLRRQCLYLRRNNAIVAGVVERFADHVVGPDGITPAAATDDDDWNDLAENYWLEWSKVADVRQRVPLREIQRLAVQARLLLGDMGLVLLSNGQVQPIEAMRIADPPANRRPERCVNGIQTSEEGIPVAYYVHPRTVGSGLVDVERYAVVRAENMVFLSRPLRIDQLRGVPELAPVLNAVTDFGRLQEETLNKATLDAMHSWAIYSESAPSMQNAVAQRVAALNGVGGDGEGAAQRPRFEHFGSGQNYYLLPGERIESLASNTPNGQFVGHCELLLKIIASSLCLPFEFLLLDFSGGSFSASRAALMTTYRTFAMWQSWLVQGMMQRLWNWRIAKAIKSGDLPPAPVDRHGWSQWWQVRWMTPRYDWIDPKQESAGDKINVELGVESVGSIAHRKQSDLEDVMRAKRRDFLAAAQECQATNAELERMGISDRLSLRDFILTAGTGAPPQANPGANKEGDEDGDQGKGV